MAWWEEAFGYNIEIRATRIVEGRRPNDPREQNNRWLNTQHLYAPQGFSNNVHRYFENIHRAGNQTSRRKYIKVRSQRYNVNLAQQEIPIIHGVRDYSSDEIYKVKINIELRQLLLRLQNGNLGNFRVRKCTCKYYSETRDACKHMRAVEKYLDAAVESVEEEPLMLRRLGTRAERIEHTRRRSRRRRPPPRRSARIRQQRSLWDCFFLKF